MAAVEELDLSNGGTALVIVGSEVQLSTDFDMHPQIMSLTPDKLTGGEFGIASRVPGNVKVVIISEKLPSFDYECLRKVLDKRQVPYMQRRGQGSLDACLLELFPRKPTTVLLGDNGGNHGPNGNGKTEKRAMAPKGSIRDLVEQADLRKGSAEEARRLMRVAQEKGISTTLGSLAQAISNRKRKMGAGEIPKSVLSPQQQALRVLDDAIENLSLIREYVQTTEAENVELKTQLKKIQEVFGKKAN